MKPDRAIKIIENARIEIEKVRFEREKVRQEFGSLFGEVSAILFEIDPISINFETNTDEYEPEVGTILPRLGTCNSLLDTRRVIHQEFVRWFDKEIAGSESHYQEAAELIWAAWQLYLQSISKL
jgi:hypothetical protein